MTDILAQTIRQAVRRPEVIEAVCAALEAQLQRELASMAGGSELYVGKRPDRAERNARIRAAFTGDNYTQLARAESLTPRQVRRILHGVPAKK
jgi:Mor family transcriptional regulator